MILGIWRRHELRTGALILFCLLDLPQLICAQESIEQILAHTEETYKSANTYQFSGIILYDWKSEGSKSRTFQQSFQCFRGNGGKIRLQLGIGMSKILALSDGDRSLLYVADRHRYSVIGSPDLAAFIRKSFDIENASGIFPSLALLEKYGHLRNRFHDVSILGNQDLTVDGRKIPCTVLEGGMEPTDIDAAWGNRKTQLWIESDQHIVLREITSGTSSSNQAKGDNLKEIITFKIAELNTAPADNLFTFHPPQGTEEVKDLFPPERESGSSEPESSDSRPYSFLYQLPFAAMRSFRLPCVGGESLSLSQFRGKFVFLDFWATWCVPCHKQSEDLERILRKHGGSSLAIIGVNSEGIEKTRAFIKKHPNAYPLILDKGGSIAALYGAKVLPTLVLLDPSGRIIFKKEERLGYDQIEQLLKDAGL
jgi:peroxiredoxin